jgi:WD40 repeat protein
LCCSSSAGEEQDDTILSSIAVHTCDIPVFKAATPLSTRAGPSCRATIFNPTGDVLYTASNGGSIAALDVNRASHYSTSDYSILWKINQASPYGIHSLYHIHPPHIGECIVTGDDEGVIRIWDVRACANASSSNSSAMAFQNCMSLPSGCISSFHEHSDIISTFQTDASCNTLLAASSDGVLSVIDLRKSGGDGNKAVIKSKPETEVEPMKLHPDTRQGPFRILRKSDAQDDELLSMCLMKNGKKVVCGTQQGVLNFWSWGTWGDISDRFPGHPQSIDALLKIDEDTLLSGSSDGVIRILQVQPDRLLGVLGDHEGFPVEKLNFGAGKKVIGSMSHDCYIRLWDASIFYDDDDGDDEEEEEEEEEEEGNDQDMQDVGKSKNLEAASEADSNEDDWEDVDSDDSMDSDSDSSDSSGGKVKRKFKSENEEFFSDL